MSVMVGETITAPYDKVSELTNQLLTLMAEKEVSIPTAIFAFALGLGRVMNPDDLLEPEQESEWVTNILDWAGTYWATEGKELMN